MNIMGEGADGMVEGKSLEVGSRRGGRGNCGQDVNTIKNE